MVTTVSATNPDFIGSGCTLPSSPALGQVLDGRARCIVLVSIIICGSSTILAACGSDVPKVSDQAKVESDQLLIQADEKRKSGELGLALELGNQAKAKWKDSGKVAAFLKEVQPQATAASKAAQAEATIQAKAQAVAEAQQAAATKTAMDVAAKTGRVGERRESGGVAITVNTVSKTGRLGQFLIAGPGKTYLVVDITIETTTREIAPYNPLYFKLKDSDLIEYNSSLLSDDRGLKSGELPRGERVRGTVAFDVPAASKGFMIIYQPIVIFGGYETIKIQLN